MESREYIGNSKRFTIDVNRKHLKIIGNDNKIDIKCNLGNLDVIGNSTRVKIGENNGKVNYIGNCGKVYIGRGSDANNVRYTGTNGTMKFLDVSDLWKRSHLLLKF